MNPDPNEYETPQAARVASQERDADWQRKSLEERLQDEVDRLRATNSELQGRIGFLQGTLRGIRWQCGPFGKQKVDEALNLSLKQQPETEVKSCATQPERQNIARAQAKGTQMLTALSTVASKGAAGDVQPAPASASDTPETDAARREVPNYGGMVFANVARSLERDRNALRTALAQVQSCANVLRAERDALQEQVERLEQDKERLDWLESIRQETCGAPTDFISVRDIPKFLTVRSAIDSAMSKTEGGK